MIHCHHHQKYKKTSAEDTQTIDWRNPARIRDFCDTAPFMMNNINIKASKGRRCRRHSHLASAKKGRKNGRKRKRKNGGTKQLQQQQEQQQSHFQQQSQQSQQQHQHQQQQSTNVLHQSNLDGLIV